MSDRLVEQHCAVEVSTLELVLDVSGLMEHSDDFNAIARAVIEDQVRLDRKTPESFQKVIPLFAHVRKLCQHRKLVQNFGNYGIGSNLVILGNVEQMSSRSCSACRERR